MLRALLSSQKIWFDQSKLRNSYSYTLILRTNVDGPANGFLRENDNDTFPLALATASPYCMLHVPRLPPRSGEQDWVTSGKFRRGFCGIRNGAAPR